MARMIQCVKLGKELEGLEEPPFPGELGERVFKEVSQEGWALWPPHATLLINHHGLTMADPQARKQLRGQLEDFYWGDGAQLPEGWTPEDSAPAMKK